MPHIALEISQLFHFEHNLCVSLFYHFFHSFFKFLQLRETKPRESILRKEFFNAIEYLNQGLAEKDNLMFLHWDLNNYSRKYTALSCSVCLLQFTPFVNFLMF